MPLFTRPRVEGCLRRAARPALAALLLLLPGIALAREVAVPIRFELGLVRDLLREQVFTGPGGTFVAWRDASGCNELVLSDPELDVEGERLRVTSRARAVVGAPHGKRCAVLLRWSGFVQTLHDPMVAPARAVVDFPVVGSRLLGPHRRPAVLAGVVWDWVGRYVHPRLSALRLDFERPLAELRAVIGSALGGAGAARARAILDSLSLYEVDVAHGALEATMVLSVPTPAGPAPPAPPLSAAELARFEDAWQSFDGFLTFVVKRSALLAGSGNAALLVELRDVLLAERYDVVDVLTSGEAGPETVRRLFLSTWARLAPVLRRLDTGLPADTALRYLGFVAAGDALAAVDRLGPGAGIDLTPDGLRRFARMIAPAMTGDPLARAPGVDPELRRLLGFGPPIPPPSASPPSPPSVSPPSPPSGPPPSPAAPSRPAPTPGLGWLGIDDALASEAPAAGTLNPALVMRLNAMIATPVNARPYVRLARELLDDVVRLTWKRGGADVRFRPLLLATAWQESCWRQFVRVGATVRPLRSQAGSVGMMQVNLNVWRGFYDPRGLATDIGYNARAGAEILAHYVLDHALPEHGKGVPDAVARAAYAAYNGGPSQLMRFRDPHEPKALRAIDEAFWKKYRAVARGNDLAVLACYGG